MSKKETTTITFGDVRQTLDKLLLEEMVEMPMNETLKEYRVWSPDLTDEDDAETVKAHDEFEAAELWASHGDYMGDGCDYDWSQDFVLVVFVVGAEGVVRSVELLANWRHSLEWGACRPRKSGRKNDKSNS